MIHSSNVDGGPCNPQTTREDVYFIGVNSVNSGKQMCMIWILYVNHEY